MRRAYSAVRVFPKYKLRYVLENGFNQNFLVLEIKYFHVYVLSGHISMNTIQQLQPAFEAEKGNFRCFVPFAFIRAT
jgi:hypothetical protein